MTPSASTGAQWLECYGTRAGSKSTLWKILPESAKFTLLGRTLGLPESVDLKGRWLLARPPTPTRDVVPWAGLGPAFPEWKSGVLPDRRPGGGSSGN